MVPKIFLTGVTGYIGGDAFYALYEKHPEYDYTLLVRNEERGKLVSAKYPNVKLVYGTLDNADVLSKAAAEADIVVHTADSSDNVPAAQAIAKGLAAGHTSEKPGYWIHVCGTGILMWYDEQHQRYGQPPLPEEKYHDIDDIGRVLTLPHKAIHRNVDEIVLAANQEPGIKTAIVGPPTIYGPGRGPVNQRSIQVYDMTKWTLQKGYAPIIGTGKTEWDNVHVHDLGTFFVLAVEAALDPEKNKNPEIFGPKAYYFLEHGVHIWGEVSKWVAEAAAKQGWLPEPKTKSIEMAEADAAEGVSNTSWGLNSKSVAARAKKYLGWTSHGRALKDEIPDIVKGEAERLGLKK